MPQLQQARLRNGWDEREVEVLQSLLGGEGGCFEALAQLVLVALGDLLLEQGLQVAEIA